VDERSNVERPAPPSRAGSQGRPRLVAAGFIGAFAASILTVVLTGLWVRSPDARRSTALPLVTLAVDEPRSINLVFGSARALDLVELTLELPEGIEVEGHAGRRQLTWRTPFRAGNNVLPVTLVARRGRGGALVARLTHGEDTKAFVIDSNVR
jgi:hypothetical protein